MILPRLRYEDLTWLQLREAAKFDPIIVQPVGAIEQHGPHLPLSTDTMQVHNIARLACEKVAERIAILIAPTMPWGFSTIQMDLPGPADRYPGTLTLMAETLMRLCIELSQSFVRAGFKRLLFLNGHGGNYQPLTTAARTIRDLTGALVAVANYYALADPTELSAVLQEPFMKHAGDWETSLALALDKENVDFIRIHQDEKAARAIRVKTSYTSRDEMGGRVFAAKVFLAEKNVDFSSEGVVGDPTLATPEKGARLVDLHVESLIKFLLEFKTWSYGAV